MKSTKKRGLQLDMTRDFGIRSNKLTIKWSKLAQDSYARSSTNIADSSSWTYLQATGNSSSWQPTRTIWNSNRYKSTSRLVEGKETNKRLVVHVLSIYIFFLIKIQSTNTYESRLSNIKFILQNMLFHKHGRIPSKTKIRQLFN